MRDSAIKRLAVAGVLAAAIVILTAVVSIPLPGGHGYINLGDAGVLTAAFLLGGPWGGLCAGIASAASDLLLGWAVYAPATFVIKGASALFAGFMLKKLRGKGSTAIVYAAALFVPVGYFLYETMLYGASVALPNILFNTIQCLVGAGVAHVLIAVLFQKGFSITQLTNENRNGRIVREPKGGPDVVIIGCEHEVDTMLKAGNLLSVRGYTARIVALSGGLSADQLSPQQRETLLAPDKPYISILSCSKEGKANAADIAEAAMEAMKK